MAAIAPCVARCHEGVDVDAVDGCAALGIDAAALNIAVLCTEKRPARTIKLKDRVGYGH